MLSKCNKDTFLISVFQLKFMTKISDGYSFWQGFLIIFQCILEIYKAASNEVLVWRERRSRSSACAQKEVLTVPDPFSDVSDKRLDSSSSKK